MKSIKFTLLAFVFMFAFSVANVFAVDGPNGDDTSVNPVVAPVGFDLNSPSDSNTNVDPTSTPVGSDTNGPGSDDTNVTPTVTLTGSDTGPADNDTNVTPIVILAGSDSNGPADNDTNVTPTSTPVGFDTNVPAGDDTNVTPTTTPTGSDSNGPSDNDTNVTPTTTPEVISTSTPATTPSTEEISTPTRRSGGGGGSRRITQAPTGNTIGEVLGAFTGEESCGTMYLTTYMRQGMANSVDEVKKLQTFLNEHMNAGLPITGFFGPLTHQAVMNFQAKYAKEVLTPWGITSPTGYVFKTTRALINNLKCANSEATPVIK